MTTKIPVNIAAQVVAAGIYGGRVRITLALTPVFDKDNGRYDLTNWPKEVEERFLANAADDDTGAEAKQFRFDVVPLKEGQSWRTANVFNAAEPIEQGLNKLKRVAPPRAGDVAKLNTYWQSVMEGEDKKGFDWLHHALNPAGSKQLRDPIEYAMRPINDDLKDGKVWEERKTPDIHGTSRSKAVQELVLERGRHVLNRFGNKSGGTRPLADPMKSLTDKVIRWRNERIGPWPGDEKDELTTATLAALVEDDDSWEALNASRQRADKLTEARREYQKLTTTSKAAICALVKAHQYLLSRTPLAAAMHFSGDGLDRKRSIGNPLPEAVAAYRLASETPTVDGAKKAAGFRDTADDERHIDFARRRLYMLQGNPSLGRLFRFVVDFECPVKMLEDAVNGAHGFGYKEVVLDRPPGAPEVLPAAVEQDAFFLLIRFCKDKGPRLWSTVKLRMPNDDMAAQASGHFLPCTREEIDVRVMNSICEKECKNDPNSQACKECKECAGDLRALAVAEQIDGIVDLGQRWKDECRYEVITLDPIVAIAAEDQKIKRDAENARTLKSSRGLPVYVQAALGEDQKGTHRGGGLALADRWRQLHGIARHLDSRGQKEQFEKGGKGAEDVILDASDLVAGYKLDVGVLDRNDLKDKEKLDKDGKVNRRRWHTLMHRTVTYTPTKNVPANLGEALNTYITKLYPDATTRDDADDGQLQAPAALRDWSASFTRTHIREDRRDWMTVFMEEVIGAWRGDPLGLACGLETYKLSPDDVRIDISYDLSTNQALTPPPLRYGWRYHFGLRAFFAGGVSTPLGRALGHYEKSYSGDLIQPAVEEGGASFRRHERIDGPAISVPDWMFGTIKKQDHHADVELKGRFPVPQGGRMMVRSFNNETNQRIAGVFSLSESEQKRTPGVGFDRRVLVAPMVSLHFAALHDAFRGKSGDDIETNVEMCEPRVLQGDKPDISNPFETNAVDGEDVELEYTPLNPERPGPAVWGTVRVAWRPYTVTSRPRGGLRGVDYRAAWGGFPIYRAKASAGLVPPKLGAPVVRPDAMTDEGEIQHRVKGDGPTIFRKSPKERQLLWSAVGVFDKEEGQSDRSGTAVFRRLDTAPDVPAERLPYYPDPAAVTLVVEVAIRGQTTRHRKPVPFYVDAKPDRGAPKDYPNAVPVVLDVVRGTGADTVISDPLKMNYRDVPNTPSPAPRISVAYVKVTLAPGDEANIRTWCVPSVTFLRHMWAQIDPIAALAVARGLGGAVLGTNVGALSFATVDQAFVKGLKQLAGLDVPQIKSTKQADANKACSGLPLPSDEQLLRCAEELHKYMLEAPVSEIAAMTEIEAVHAVDLPKQEPRAVAGQKWQLLRTRTDLIEHLLEAEKECRVALDPLNLGHLCTSNNWTQENQMPDAVDVLIDGSLTVHGPSTGAVEIYARGTAVARGRFDDVERGRSRDDRARGLWPKPDAQEPIKPMRLFGFDPAEDGSVSFEPEVVNLLRIEGFAPIGETRIDLLNFQRDAKAIEPKPGEEIKPHDPPLRATRLAGFPDTRARWIEVFAVAISRHATALRTRYDELPEVLTRPESALPNATKEEKEKAEERIRKAIMDRRWLPATVRPARAVALSPIPSFQWTDSTPTPATAKITPVFTKRSVRIRVRVKRPWLSAGEGERIGVVVWPPNLFAKDVGNVRYDIVKPPPADRKEINLRTLPEDGTVIRELQDADLGAGGAWVTRWGADPTLAQGGVQGWLLSRDNFPGVITGADFSKPPAEHPRDAVLIENVLMPVPADADAAELRVAQPPGGFMTVSLITYTPRFDADQENWYVDLYVDPCGAVYPQVRLGLVRYQPNAKAELQVSEPIVEWARIMPDRTLSATAKYVSDRKEIEVTAMVEGVSSGSGDNNGHPESSPAQAPLMRFTLMQRRLERDDEIPGSEYDFGGTQILGPNCGSPCANWSAAFRIGDEEYKQYGWSICVEEVDRRRPATYADEPRYQTLVDTSFVDTGPPFVARVLLDNLKVT